MGIAFIPLRERARGHWRSILLECGIYYSHLNGKNGPCPLCGGRDRFRFLDYGGDGTWICNQCSNGVRSGITLALRFTGLSFKHIAEKIDRSISNAPPLARSPPPVPRSASNDNFEPAMQIWHESVEGCGTLLDAHFTYRGLEWLEELDSEVIRFHPRLWYQGYHVPGMIALYRDIKTDEPRALHRTFLDWKGHKIGRKMFGPVKGAAIKLSRDEEVTHGLHVAEGIESGIAGMLAGFRPMWAMGCAAGIKELPVLEGIETLTILGEVDDGGANARAVAACAERWLAAGREVYAVAPLIGGDFNDVWRKVA